jgi:hypothetical protein
VWQLSLEVQKERICIFPGPAKRGAYTLPAGSLAPRFFSRAAVQKTRLEKGEGLSAQLMAIWSEPHQFSQNIPLTFTWFFDKAINQNANVNSAQE